jgi:hypothetical protein
MTDCIDTPLSPAELSARNSVFNRPPSETKLQKLAAADNAMLSLGELPDPVVN